MKTNGGGSRGIAPPLLTSALDGSEWSALCPCCSTPRERAPSILWIGGRVGPRASLDTASCPCWQLNPSHPACDSSLHQLSYPSSFIHICLYKKWKNIPPQCTTALPTYVKLDLKYVLKGTENIHTIRLTRFKQKCEGCIDEHSLWEQKCVILKMNTVTNLLKESKLFHVLGDETYEQTPEYEIREHTITDLVTGHKDVCRWRVPEKGIIIWTKAILYLHWDIEII